LSYVRTDRPLTASLRSYHASGIKVTVTLGPAPHGPYLLDALMERGIPHRTVRLWPRFAVEDWEPEGGPRRLVARSPFHDRLQWLTWATWRRIPWAKHYETPHALLFAVSDLLAQRYVAPCDLFVGWSQVSLYSLRRARR